MTVDELEARDRRYAALIDRAMRSLDGAVEGAMFAITEALYARMEEQGVSRSELARRIGVSPSWITKVMQGNVNLTLESMVKLARALGAQLRLGLEDLPEERMPRGEW